VGDAYDNAVAESVLATLEREVLNRRKIRSQAEAKMAMFERIEGWYNRRRRHSSLGYRSPANYERAHAGSAASWRSPDCQCHDRMISLDRSAAAPRPKRDF
jgi:transposase InsO family protein